MKKILLSLFMLSAGYADSGLEPVEENMKAIKTTRLRLQQRSQPIRPHHFDKERERIYTALDNKIVSTTQYASPQERILVLNALFQNRILETKFSSLKTHNFRIEGKDHQKRHFAALQITKKGVEILHDQPLLSRDLKDFTQRLRASFDMTNDFFRTLLSSRALKILFPQGFFTSLASYAYNFSDYQKQDDLKIALALTGVTPRAAQGFNVQSNRSLTVDYSPYPLIKMAEKEEDVVLWEFLGQIGDTHLINKFFPRPYLEDIRVVAWPPEIKECLSLSKAQVIMPLLSSYTPEDKVYLKILSDTLPIPTYLGSDYIPGSISLGSFIEGNPFSLDEAITNLELLDASLKTEQAERLLKLLKALQALGVYETSSHIFSPNIFSIFSLEHDQLELTDEAINLLSKMGQQNNRTFQEHLRETVQQQFEMNLIGTHIPLPEDLEEKALKYNTLLNNPLYRSEEFLHDICARIHHSNFQYKSEDEKEQIENFLASFKREEDKQQDVLVDDSLPFLQEPEELSRNLYEYVLTLSLLKTRQPQEEEDETTLKYFTTLPAFKEYMAAFHGVPFEAIDPEVIRATLQEGDLNSWVNKSLAYLSLHGGTGTNELLAEEIDRPNFYLDELFPIWKKGSYNKDVMEFGPDPFYTLVTNWEGQEGFSACELSLKMYCQWALYKQFFSLQDNVNAFTYDPFDRDSLRKALSSSKVFENLSAPLEEVIIDLYLTFNGL